MVKLSYCMHHHHILCLPAAYRVSRKRILNLLHVFMCNPLHINIICNLRRSFVGAHRVEYKKGKLFVVVTSVVHTDLSRLSVSCPFVHEARKRTCPLGTTCGLILCNHPKMVEGLYTLNTASSQARSGANDAERRYGTEGYHTTLRYFTNHEETTRITPYY